MRSLACSCLAECILPQGVACPFNPGARQHAVFSEAEIAMLKE
jgi:hypothetical protein